MEPVEFLKKPYARMVLPDTDGTFSAEIVEFSGCIAVGNSAAEALANLEEVALDWIAAAREQGQNIPEPMETAGFSGRLVLRMPKGLHKRATLCAERDGISLNSFIVTCIAEQVGARSRTHVVRHQAFPIVYAIASAPIGVWPGAVYHGIESEQLFVASSADHQMTGITMKSLGRLYAGR